jgi:hypothetical protein
LDRLITSRHQVDNPPQITTVPISFIALEPPPPPLPPPAITSKPSSILIFDYDARRLNPDAVYTFLNGNPKGFGKHDYIYIEISRKIEAIENTTDHVAFGISKADGFEALPASFALVTNSRVFFATGKTSDGFEYRFDGQFLRSGNIAVALGKNVLKGKLTKTKNGRTVKEWTVKLGIAEDAC